MKRNSCKCSNRRNSLKNLISDYKNLHTEQKTLQKKQTAYLALAQAADEQLQAYTRMQRAFLDAQASILAGSLQAGIPCPVCSSVEHPRPAVLSEHAPTEEQVKCAKTAYDDAQAAASAASETALTDAQTKEKSSLNTLTATRAAIRQLREQLKTGADADLDKLSAKLHIQRGSERRT